MFKKPDIGDLREAATKLGVHPSDEYLKAAEAAAAALAGAYATLDEMVEEWPPVKYPREGGHKPGDDENLLGAWSVKASIKGPPGGLLTGRRLVLKDNICLAGLPMSIGTDLLADYVPEVDATIVDRLLGAGAEIVGKAVCEYFCVSGGSHTSRSGPVHNPHRRGYSAGGSSSGSAALVAAGEVDMAIGGDQAGSIRIPASHCGIVGMKPTFGLVPYTGVAPMEVTLDTIGPMTTTVRDNALLLQVVAGPDGLDSRQRGVEVSDYSARIEEGATGLRIGVVREGFGHANSEADVDIKVRGAAQRFLQLGATVEDISIPIHSQGYAVWAALRGDPAAPIWLATNGSVVGYEGLYLTSLMQAVNAWRNDPDSFPDTVKIASILSRYTFDAYGGHYYAKAQNLRRSLRAAYDAELAKFDLLLMPTVPMKPAMIPGPDASPQEVTRRSWEPTRNTCPFNVTGHPAISIPCGLSDGLPIGLMLVGKHFNEAMIYRGAEAFETSGDWTTL